MKRSLSPLSQRKEEAKLKKLFHVTQLEETLLTLVDADGALLADKVNAYADVLKTISKLETRGLYLAILERTVMLKPDRGKSIIGEIARSRVTEVLVKWLKFYSSELESVATEQKRIIEEYQEIIRFILRQLLRFPVGIDKIEALNDKGLWDDFKNLKRKKHLREQTMLLAKTVCKAWTNRAKAENVELEKKRKIEKALKEEEARQAKKEVRLAREKREAAERKRERAAEKLKALKKRRAEREAELAAPLFSTFTDIREQQEIAKARTKKRVRWAEEEVPTVEDITPRKGVEHADVTPTGKYNGWGFLHIRYIDPRPNKVGSDGNADGSSVEGDDVYLHQDHFRQMRKQLAPKIEWRPPKSLSSICEPHNLHIAVQLKSEDAKLQAVRLAGTQCVQYSLNDMPDMPDLCTGSVIIVKPNAETANVPLNEGDALEAAILPSAQKDATVLKAPSPPKAAIQQLDELLSNPTIMERVQARQKMVSPQPVQSSSFTRPSPSSQFPRAENYRTSRDRGHYPRNGRGEYAPRGGRGGYAPRGGRGGYAPRGGRGGYAPRGGRGGYAPRGGRGGYAPRGGRGGYAARGYQYNRQHRGGW